MLRNGIIVSMATPFAADGTVDVVSLRRYVRYVLRAGATGILTPAIAGEVTELTESERRLIVATTVEETAGRVPVIGCASAATTPLRIESARGLLADGCRAILVHVPASPDTDIPGSVRRVADLGPELLMIQDADTKGPGLPVDVIAGLHAELSCFGWVKMEVVGRCRKITALRAAAGPGLRIGTAGLQMVEALDRGVDAYMPTILPDVYDAVFRLHAAGRRGEAAALFERLLPIILFPYTHPPLPLIKRLLHRQGIFTTERIRRAGETLDETEDRYATELVEQAIGLVASL